MKIKHVKNITNANQLVEDNTMVYTPKQPLVPDGAMNTVWTLNRTRFFEPCARVGWRLGGPSLTNEKLCATSHAKPHARSTPQSCVLVSAVPHDNFLESMCD